MRVLIVDTARGYFVGANKTWVKDRKLARNFRTEQAAIKYALKNNLGGIELCRAFLDPSQDVTIPIDEDIILRPKVRRRRRRR